MGLGHRCRPFFYTHTAWDSSCLERLNTHTHRDTHTYTHIHAHTHSHTLFSPLGPSTLTTGGADSGGSVNEADIETLLLGWAYTSSNLPCKDRDHDRSGDGEEEGGKALLRKRQGSATPLLAPTPRAVRSGPCARFLWMGSRRESPLFCILHHAHTLTPNDTHGRTDITPLLNPLKMLGARRVRPRRAGVAHLPPQRGGPDVRRSAKERTPLPPFPPLHPPLAHLNRSLRRSPVATGVG